MSSSLGKSSLIVSNKNSVHDDNSKLADFDFCELNQSKFFTKPSEVDSDDANDHYESEIENWTLKKQNKKRKSNATPTDDSKRLNRKTTPKTRNKK